MIMEITMLSRGKVALGIVCLAGLGGLAVGMVWYLSPLFITHPEQDACSFGEVSNEKFRDLLIQAQINAKEDHTKMSEAVTVGKNEIIQQILDRQFSRIQKADTDIYIRIAAMHAVLRANMARYISTRPDTEDPFETIKHDESPLKPSAISYEYHINTIKYGELRPIYRTMAVRVWYFVENVAANGGNDIRYHANTFKFNAYIPNLIKPISLAEPSHRSYPCPPVPKGGLQHEQL